MRVGGKKKEVSEELRRGLEIFGVEKSVPGGGGGGSRENYDQCMTIGSEGERRKRRRGGCGEAKQDEKGKEEEEGGENLGRK